MLFAKRPIKIKKWLVIFSVLIIFLLSVNLAKAASSAEDSSLFNPLIYQGIYTKQYIPALENLEKITGKKSSLIHIFGQWETGTGGVYEPGLTGSGCGKSNFSFTVCLQEARDRGAIPVYSWGSENIQDPSRDSVYALKNIINGNFDSYITKFALEAKAWGHPFFLRLDQEMNCACGFSWGYNTNGNVAGEYAKMWRHVHDIFTKNGVTNVTWVWCPSAWPAPFTTTLSRLADLYPGDAYVDWLGVDLYNHFTAANTPNGVRKAWYTFSELLSPTYTLLNSLSPKKPIMIAEFGSKEQDGNKATWITDALGQLPKNFPRVQAIMWWNVDVSQQGGYDYRIQSSTASTQAYQKAIQISWYAPNNYANFNLSPIPAPWSFPTPTPAPTPIAGDIDQNKKIDVADYNTLVANFGKTGTPGFIPSDINKDGKVDIFDYNILVGNYGKTIK